MIERLSDVNRVILIRLFISVNATTGIFILRPVTLILFMAQ